jgi:hypothetical protein
MRALPRQRECFSAQQRRRGDSLILSSMGKRGVGPLRRAGTRAKVGTEDVARSFGHVVHGATARESIRRNRYPGQGG